MKIDRTGCFRIVILTKNFAFKIPNFLDGWYLFKRGLLSNVNEKKCSINTNLFCPVKFYINGGFLVVMPKVKVLSDDEFLKLDWNVIRNDMRGISVERKSNSFGYLNGKVVCIDYGNP